jgi:hypothetical protein
MPSQIVLIMTNGIYLKKHAWVKMGLFNIFVTFDCLVLFFRLFTTAHQNIFLIKLIFLSILLFNITTIFYFQKKPKTSTCACLLLIRKYI